MDRQLQTGKKLSHTVLERNKAMLFNHKENFKQDETKRKTYSLISHSLPLCMHEKSKLCFPIELRKKLQSSPPSQLLFGFLRSRCPLFLVDLQAFSMNEITIKVQFLMRFHINTSIRQQEENELV